MSKEIKWCHAFLCALMSSTAYSNYYSGIGLGADNIDFKQKAQVVFSNPAHPDQGFNVHDDSDLSGMGLFGTIFVGYEYSYNQLYLATEVNGNISSASFNSSNAEAIHDSFSSTEYKINNTYGFSLLPGYQYTPDTLFYARLGYDNAHFKVNTSDTSLQNVSKRLDGFRWGLGIKQSIIKQIDMRLEFSQINYNTTNLATFDALSSVAKGTRITPIQQLFEFGFVYHFA